MTLYLMYLIQGGYLRIHSDLVIIVLILYTIYMLPFDPPGPYGPPDLTPMNETKVTRFELPELIVFIYFKQ